MLRAVLDADVLYPMPLRDTLLSAAAAYCFEPLWSGAILEEATRNLIAKGRMTPDQAETFRQVLVVHFEEARIEGFEALIPSMKVHAKDRHVAAAAMHAGADAIVTRNTKHFAKLPVGLAALTPDAFLLRLLAERPDELAEALAAQSARLKKPPISVDGILDLLAPTTPGFVAAWRSLNC